MKKNLISSILSLVMTSLLLIGVVVAWYTSNKEVSASNIVGVSSSPNASGILQKYDATLETPAWVDSFNLDFDNFGPDDKEYFRLKITTSQNNVILNSGFMNIKTSLAKDDDDNFLMKVNNTTNYTITRNDIDIYKYYTYHITNLLFRRYIDTVQATNASSNALVYNPTSDIQNHVLDFDLKLVENEVQTIVASVTNINIVNNRIESMNIVDGASNPCTYIMNQDGLSFKIISSTKTTLANVSCTLTDGTLVIGNDQTLNVQSYESSTPVEFTLPTEYGANDNKLTIGDDVITLTTSNGKLASCSSTNANLKFKIDSNGLGFRIINNLGGVPGEANKVLYYVSGNTMSLKDYLLGERLSLYNYETLLNVDKTPTELEAGISESVKFSAKKNLSDLLITNHNVATSGTYYLYFKISFDSSASNPLLPNDNYYQYQKVEIDNIYIEEV